MKPAVFASHWAAVAFATLAVLPLGTTQAAVATTGCANATSCTLSELLGGGSLTVNGIKFSGFTGTDSSLPANPIDAGLVTVTGLDDGSLDPGPGFRVLGNGELATGAGQFLSYEISFNIENTAGQAIIKDASLNSFGASSVGTGDEWSVAGRVPATKFQNLLILESTLQSNANVFTDEVDLDEVFAAVSAKHTLNFNSFNGTGASLTGYDFRVSLVPVPAALPLLVSGLVALGARVSRKRA